VTRPAPLALFLVALLSHGTHTRAATLTCGARLSPGEVVVLEGGIGPCTGEPALIVDSAQLDLGGFDVVCDHTATGVRIEGKGARLSNGRVIDCGTASGDPDQGAIAVGGSGGHTVENVTVLDRVDAPTLPEFRPALVGVVTAARSKGNRLSNNHVDGPRIGFLVLGRDNVLVGNTAERGEQGFAIYGVGNTLEDNTANGNAGGCRIDATFGRGGNGFVLYGRNHQVRRNTATANVRCQAVEDDYYNGNGFVVGAENQYAMTALQKLARRGARQVLLEENVAADNSGSGMLVGGPKTRKVTLTGNEATGNGGNGISGGTEVIGNSASSNGATGISGSVLRDNVSTNNGGSGLASAGVITNNVTTGNGEHGIYVHSGSVSEARIKPAVIEGNSSRANGGNGLLVTYLGRVKLTDNLFEENGLDGIHLRGADKNVITANTVRNNGGAGIALRIVPNTGVIVDFEARRNTVTNNTVSGHAAPDVDLFDEHPACGSNRWSENVFGTKSQDCIR
jgi:parallel beta-helix repeat protein